MYKIFTLIFFLTSIAVSGLWLKEKKLFIFKDDSVLQRQVVEITQDDVFENFGFQYLKPNLDKGSFGYNSYQTGRSAIISSQAGTRIFFISKAPIIDFIKPLSDSSTIEIFKDDFGKDMIRAGQEDQDFIRWKEKYSFSSSKESNSLEVYKTENEKIVVIFNSATKLSDNAHEIFLKAKIRYLAPNKNSEIISKMAKVEDLDRDSELKLIGRYDLSFDDMKISLVQSGWIDKDDAVYKLKIEKTDVKLVEINLTDADGKKIASKIVGEEIHITAIPGVKFVMPAEVEVKYLALESREIELSQIFQIAKND